MTNAKQPARKGRATGARAELKGTRSLVMNGEIMLYGIVDSYVDPYDDAPSCLRSLDVMASIIELADQPRLSVRINSPGGNVMEGLSIYNALRNAGKPIDIHIDAMAASIASVIAMAGDTISIAETGTVMIHNPWDVAVGDAQDLRNRADEIDRLKAIIVDIYANRTGASAEEIDALMTAETYMSAADAVERGFADAVEPALAIAACEKLTPEHLARLNAPVSARAIHGSKAAAPAATPKEGSKMDPVTQNGGIDPVAPTPAVVPPVPDLNAIRAEAAQTERDRVSGILAQARTAKIPAEDPFIANLLSSTRPLADARNDIIGEWSKRQEARSDNPPGNELPAGRVEVTADAVDKWAQGAQRGLMIRAGIEKPTDADRGNEFTGLTLLELARSSLSVRNIKTGSMDRMTMVGTAFTVRNAGPGMHSTSDFPTIIQNVAYRAVLKGYTEVDETFQLWTGKGTASDFRPINRVDMGLFPALSKVEEGAEYTFATLGDNGTVVQVATYGKMFAITRQAIVNDDLQFFQRVPERMGRAAKRTIGNLVYAILNGNPTMQDGVALFHANHANLAGSGAAPSVAAIAAAMAAMQVQKDDAGVGTGGGIQPRYILTPPALWLPTAYALNSATVPGDAAQLKNPIQGMFTPISDSRLSGTSWFMAADPSQTDTIEVTYLDGVEEPFLDQRDGWNVDGTEFKVRMDAGVKALHWRGLYKNAGA